MILHQPDFIDFMTEIYQIHQRFPDIMIAKKTVPLWYVLTHKDKILHTWDKKNLKCLSAKIISATNFVHVIFCDCCDEKM